MEALTIIKDYGEGVCHGNFWDKAVSSAGNITMKVVSGSTVAAVRGDRPPLKSAHWLLLSP